MDDGINHGSYAGYQVCQRRPEGSCEECRKATREYMAEYRKRRPEVQARERLKRRARERALWKLARQFPREYRVLVHDEMTRAGVA